MNWHIVVVIKTYLEGRKLKPDNKDGLEGKVKGEIVQNQPQSKTFEESEETKHNPVRQPLHVILMLRGLERLEGEVGREAPSNKIWDGCCERIDEDEKGEKGYCAENSVGFGNLCLFLNLVQDRIFCQLNKTIQLNDKKKSDSEYDWPPCRAGWGSSWPYPER